jgi:hypothetical protein
MENPPGKDDEEAQKRYQEHFERARKGVLKFLNDKGGKLPLAEMHDYSLNKFLIQHQGFSRMMETFVDQGLVDFDQESYEATITEAGRKFISA